MTQKRSHFCPHCSGQVHQKSGAGSCHKVQRCLHCGRSRPLSNGAAEGNLLHENPQDRRNRVSHFFLVFAFLHSGRPRAGNKSRESKIIDFEAGWLKTGGLNRTNPKPRNQTQDAESMCSHTGEHNRTGPGLETKPRMQKAWLVI